MAGSDATVSLPGLKEGGADNDELFLKVFSGLVLSAFEEKNIVQGRIRERTISFGKSATFPVIGRAGVAFHVRGTDLRGTAGINQINHEEQIVLIDDRITSSIFIDELDELKNHYDVRSEYSRELGFALANDMDERVLRVISLAARGTHPLIELPDGKVLLKGASVETDADTLQKAISEAAQTLDENEVPKEDRFCALRPAQFHLLIRDGSIAINKDFTGSGRVDEALLPRLHGFGIVTSNHLPDATSPTATVAGEKNTYFDAAGFANLVSLCWHRSTVGTVKLDGLRFEMERKLENLGHLMVAHMGVGHGILRTEAAVEISKGV